MREQETVKGVARRVVIVRSPAESVFEEAIFIVREEAERSGGVSREEVLREARRAAGAYVGAVSPPQRLPDLGRPRHLRRRPRPRPGHNPHMTREINLHSKKDAREGVFFHTCIWRSISRWRRAIIRFSSRLM